MNSTFIRAFENDNGEHNRIYMIKIVFIIKNGTVIGIPLSFNWDTMSITLNKMSDFIDIFQKIQHLAFISKHSDQHSSLELLSLLELLP